MMSSKVLIVLTSCFALSFAGWTAEEITLNNYTKFDIDHVISTAWQQLTPYLDMRYHVAHLGGDKVLSFKLELRGSDGKEWNDKTITTQGYYYIIEERRAQDSPDSPASFFEHVFNSTHPITKWIGTLPRKEIMDPKRGLFRAEKNRLKVQNYVMYGIEEIVTAGEVTIN